MFFDNFNVCAMSKSFFIGTTIEECTCGMSGFRINVCKGRDCASETGNKNSCGGVERNSWLGGW